MNMKPFNAHSHSKLQQVIYVITKRVTLILNHKTKLHIIMNKPDTTTVNQCPLSEFTRVQNSIGDRIYPILDQSNMRDVKRILGSSLREGAVLWAGNESDAISLERY